MGDSVPNEDLNSIILNVEEATALTESGMQRIGYGAEEARVIAANLVSSELMGYPTMGIARVLTVAEHALTKQPRKPISVTHETAISARVDCGNNVGLCAIHRVTEIAIEKAGNARFALIGAHNSFLSGRNAYYLDMITPTLALSGFTLPVANLWSPPWAAPRLPSARTRSALASRMNLIRLFWIWVLQQ